MARFLKYILTCFFLAALACFALDFVYTKIISSAKNRELTQRLNGLHNQHFDYIILGNSRTEFGLNPVWIEEQTKRKGINLSFNGGRLIDNLMCLDWFWSNGNRCEKIILQVDDVNGFHKAPSALFKPMVVPFARIEPVKNYIPEMYADAWAIQHLPFYRYARYNFHWNPKELIACLALDNDPSSLGYQPLFGQIPEGMPNTQLSLPDINPDLNRMLEFCKQENIELIVITAPIYQAENPEQFEAHLLPSLNQSHYINAVEWLNEDRFFKDSRHLNHTGAKAFSQRLADSLVTWNWRNELH